MTAKHPMPKGPAQQLEDIWNTISPEPLLTKQELAIFYKSELNEVRGGDKVERLKLGLIRGFQKIPYKVLITGHPGVGKSTELTRLIFDDEIRKRFHPIRISATSELNPVQFNPLDVLLITMIEIAEESEKIIKGWKPSEHRLKEIQDFFAKEEVSVTTSSGMSGSASAGASLSGGALWEKITGLFLKLRGEIKFGQDRTEKRIEYRLTRISQLLDITNRLLDECNDKLREGANREWVVIFDNFEKPEIPPDKVRELFLTYGSTLKALRLHMMFTVPVALTYSTAAVGLPFPHEIIPDTPVFTSKHTPHVQGRKAIQEILNARVNPSLFAKGQQERIIQASGGNLRDLFFLVTFAADSALLRKTGSKIITADDSDRAITELRVQYERKIGQSPFDEKSVTYADKAKRLVKAYCQDPEVKVPDAVLLSLLRANAIQEFNGDRWFGVHPMVVRILEDQGLIAPKKSKAKRNAKKTGRSAR